MYLDPRVRRSRRLAFGMLLGGLAMAVATPAYISYAAPGLAGYLLHWPLIGVQTIPYLLCGALWLPWRSQRAARAAIVLAAVLLAASVVAYVPMLWAPGARGGDMIGVAFTGISAVMTMVMLAGSGLALIIIRWHARRA